MSKFPEKKKPQEKTSPYTWPQDHFRSAPEMHRSPKGCCLPHGSRMLAENQDCLFNVLRLLLHVFVVAGKHLTAVCFPLSPLRQGNKGRNFLRRGASTSNLTHWTAKVLLLRRGREEKRTKVLVAHYQESLHNCIAAQDGYRDEEF